MSDPTVPLYQKRIPIHPRSVKGRFRTLKTGILVLAYLVYFVLPWLRWDRPNAPDQAVPVSYTHLDVYKRQGHDGGLLSI